MKRLGLMVGLMMVAQVGFSTLVVNYSVVTNDPAAPLRSYTSSNSTKVAWNFSDSTPLFGGVAANGTKVYGGVIEAGASPITSQASIAVATTQRLVFQAAAATGVNTLRGVVLWDRADFLAPAGGSNWTFDAASSITANIFRNDGTAQWVIRNGSTYFISQAVISGIATNPPAALTGTSMGNWAAWDPTANGGDFSTVPLSGFAAQTFTDVTAVGVYFNDSRTTSARFTIEKDGFTVNLTPVAIPEPVTVGMLGLGAVLMLIIRRIRRV